MNAKTYLNQLRVLDAVIRSRKEQIERLRQERTYITAVTYDSDRVQTSGNPDPMKGIDLLVDLEREVAKDIEAAEKLRRRLIGEIGQVQNPLYVQVLLHRYVDGMSLEAIACEMHYSYFRIRHVHGEALRAFERMKEPG